MALHEQPRARHLRFSRASQAFSFSVQPALEHVSRVSRHAWRHAPVFAAHALMHASSLQLALQPPQSVTQAWSQVWQDRPHSARQSSPFEKHGSYEHDWSKGRVHERGSALAPSPRGEGSARQSVARRAIAAGSVHAATPLGSTAGMWGARGTSRPALASAVRAGRVSSGATLASLGGSTWGTSIGAREHACRARTPATMRTQDRAAR